MKLWVDDERPAPPGWDLARNYQEAIEKLTANEYEELSLDHDIASFDSMKNEKTGYDIALLLAERRFCHGAYVPPIIHVHSANPVGKARIEGVINRYLK